MFKRDEVKRPVWTNYEVYADGEKFKVHASYVKCDPHGVIFYDALDNEIAVFRAVWISVINADVIGMEKCPTT